MQHAKFDANIPKFLAKSVANSFAKSKLQKYSYSIECATHITKPHTMQIGYARVSTDDQLLDLQLDALSAHGCENIYREHASAKSIDRPELDATLKALRTGDSLVVWRLDRLGRSLHDLTKIVTDLETRGVGFVSLTEQINTGTPSGKLVFHLFASLAEFERNLIRERTQAGLKSARARGRNGGRPQKLAGKNLAIAKTLMADKTNDVTEIAKHLKVHRSTLYRRAKTS
jgi:DNA invertase Pin-like site-specific DNA recombinase